MNEAHNIAAAPAAASVATAASAAVFSSSVHITLKHKSPFLFTFSTLPYVNTYTDTHTHKHTEIYIMYI